MNLVKVRYFIGENEMSSREYTYYSEAPLQVGDLVTVPVRDTIGRAKVSAIDVPESEIEAFKDKVKTIPAGVPNRSVPNETETVIRVDPGACLAPAETHEVLNATNGGELRDKAIYEAFKPTSLALLNPRHDATFVALGDQVLGLVRYAETRTIATVEDEKRAIDDLGLIANLKRAIEDKRTGYVKPFNDHVKEVNGLFKLVTDPLDRADKINRQKVLNYNAEQNRKRREAEEINRMREEAAKREAALSGMIATESGVVNPATGEIVTPVEKVVVPEAPAAHVHGTAASMGTRKDRKYRIVNFAMLPDIYKLENVVLLNRVTKAGIPEIPGCELYFEDSLRITK